MDYFLHLRPRSWPIVAGHMSVGYLIALPITEWAASIIPLLIGAITWAIMLNGGTLAFNSNFMKIRIKETQPLQSPWVSKGQLNFR